MKKIWKYIGLFAFGLFTAGILYPFLHESGHSILAILLGSRVVEFQILPIPMMVCDAGQKALWQQIAIGFGGMGLPVLFSAVLFTRKFWIWYVGLLLTLINILALVISAVSVFSPVPNDDAATILRLWPNGGLTCLMCFLIMIFGLFVAVILSRPVKRISDYFL